MASPASFSRKNVPKFLALAALLFIFFAVILAVGGAFGGWSDVQNAFDKLTLGSFVFLTAMFLLNTFFRGLRWPLSAKKLGLQVPLGRLWLYYVAGFSMAATPGKIGTMLRLWLLKQKQGLSYAQTTPLFVMDQMTDLLAVLALAGWGILVFTGFGSHFIAILAFVLAGVSLFVWPALPRRGVKAFYALVGRRKPRFFAKVLRFLRRLTHLFSPTSLSILVGLSALGWLAEIASMYYLLNLFGSPVAFQVVAAVFCLSLLLSIFSFLPGGIGVAEAGMVGLLSFAGVPFPVAIATTALVRFFTLWIAVLLGLCVLPFAMKMASDKT